MKTLTCVFGTVLFIIVVLSWSGCCFSTVTEVTVSLPLLPDGWRRMADELGYICTYPAESGDDGEFTTIRGTSWYRTVTIRVPKQNNVPVLVYPEYRGVTLKPAGGIVPYDTTQENFLLLSWEHGFIAELLKRIYYTSHSAPVVNVDRLVKAVERESEDPWAVDMDKIAEGLQFASFSANSIKGKEKLTLSIEASPGQWIGGNPFAYPLWVDEDGILTLNSIYPGFHRFFKVYGGERIDLFIDDGEYYAVNPYRGSTEFGRW